ncbi:MAG TPA: FG-GAP-like repeat-containing protein [Opitutus sp.]|nr:FG-GAP-like repeat-containing protein [Opitutus sp.]
MPAPAGPPFPTCPHAARAPRPRLGRNLSLAIAATLACAVWSEAGPAGNPEFCSPIAPTLDDAALLAAGVPASTRKMAAQLNALTRAGTPFDNPYYRSPELVQVLQPVVARTTDPAELLKLMIPYGDALLRSGAAEEAVAAFQRYGQLLEETHTPVTPGLFIMLQTRLALAQLRLGEQENCLINHNADSCLFPIRGGGIHQLPRGSRGAIEALTPILRRYPGDLRARWLLNIAYMTLGQYPAEVPPQWLIDPKVFESDYDIKRFPDVAGALGIDVDDLAGGVVMDDFDGDGFLDLMVSAWGSTSQLRFFHNNGDGTFTDRTAAAHLLGETGGLNLIQGDYNNDGLIDVLVLRGAWLGALGHIPSSLLRNNGDGTFTDVTEEAGLLSLHPTQTAVWFDYNNDGWLDLFIGNESGGKEVNPCELFRNNGDGTFTECAAENGIAVVGFIKAVVAGDFNNDGRPDLYLSNRDGANFLLRNDGPAGPDHSPRAPWKFTDVAKEAGVTEPFHSFSCWFWDYDNDGRLDLMVTGYDIQDVGDVAADYLGLPNAGERARLYHNRGDGTFEDVTKQVGLFKVLHTMGANFGDLDNDGWLDFYVGTGDPDFATLIPNRMFRNDGGRHFQDVTTSGGFGQIQKGHAIAFGDINNDGNQDIYSVVGGAVTADHYHNQLFANPGHGNHWLKLKLDGVRSNRAALGARIKVVVRTPAGERAIYRSVTSGGSFGASPLRQEIGLGNATAIVRAEIFWPTTGLTQIVPGLAPDHAYEIREGTDNAVALNLRSFPLFGSDHRLMPAQNGASRSANLAALAPAPPKKS